MQAINDGYHTGKLVLDVPTAGLVPVVVPPAHVPVFRRDGAYIVTGGLESVGLLLAEQIASAGVGRLVLCSQTQPTLEAVERIDAIRATGADVVIERGDITDPDTAPRLVDTATATGLPVCGVLHAAALTEDAMLPDVTDDLVESSWAPKVDGAWNLHTATAAMPLDWFCLFSSVAALVGSPGRAADAMANSWLDAFALWRQHHGLPATTIAWGDWAQSSSAIAADADGAIGAEEVTYALEILLRHARAYSGYAAIAGTPWFSAFAQRTPFAEAFRATQRNSAAATELRAELTTLPREEWPHRLRRLLSDHVSAVVRRDIDPDRPLPECGIDSLGALELCTRIESATGVRVRATEITTIRALAELLCERLTPAELVDRRG
jgi:polyketide synthase 5